MAAYWTIKKDEDVEDVKTVKAFDEDRVGGNKQQLPPKQVYHCSECGAEIRKGDVFCPGCGKKLEHYDFED